VTRLEALRGRGRVWGEITTTMSRTDPNLTEGVSTRPPSDRLFGLAVSCALAALALVPLLRGRPPRVWALAACAALLLLALVTPALLHPLNLLWTRIGAAMGQMATLLISTLTFFALIVPIAIVLRALGKDLLNLGFDSRAQTYWLSAGRREPGRESMRRQF